MTPMPLQQPGAATMTPNVTAVKAPDNDWEGGETPFVSAKGEVTPGGTTPVQAYRFGLTGEETPRVPVTPGPEAVVTPAGTPQQGSRTPVGFGEETPRVDAGMPPPAQWGKRGQASRLDTPSLSGPFGGITPDIGTPQGGMLPPGMETPRLEQGQSGQSSVPGEVTPFIPAGGTGEMTPSIATGAGEATPMLASGAGEATPMLAPGVGDATPMLAPGVGGEITPRAAPPVGGEMTPRLPGPAAPAVGGEMTPRL